MTINLRANLLAACGAPCAIIPAALVLALALSVISTSDLFVNLVSWFFIALFGLFVSYPLTFFYGVPVFLLLEKVGLAKLPAVVAVGLAPGVFSLLTEPDKLGGGLMLGYFSLAVALAYWGIHRAVSRDAGEALTKPQDFA